MYEYNAILNRVIDGDTLVIDQDLGRRVWLHDEHVRLNRINCPPTGTAAGDQAKKMIQQYEGQAIKIRTFKPDPHDKYGRYLAEVIINPNTALEFNLSDYLVQNGYGVYWNGQGLKPE